MTFAVTHDARARRFSTEVDGHACELDYDLRDGEMTILHTGVPSAVGGRGIAAALAGAALDHARAQGWKVVPLCSYAAGFIERHPEYSDLLA
ncbi:GNAT family N-acetyltransferase [Bordetella flabilis]|uniref:Acetyltransferase n=1 Tax=Bordetella flabilis TaxID=463014 RepID=A0A193GC46_9BORD|nr:GNAT family N-acetyltransferase [Bordetella flabilis]ANN77036.1 acetyltransferase [Bordetella flabilis]